MQTVDIDLEAHVKNPTWRVSAACRGIDASLFHPERGEDAMTPKTFCETCSVSEPCLAFALVNYEKHGIWGGTSEKERRVLRNILFKEGRISPPPPVVL